MKKSLFLCLLVLAGLVMACNEELQPVEVTAISLSKSELTLEKGANEILTVTFTPADATDKSVTWVSSDTGIATVDDGIVVGVAPGRTEIIAKCGDATARCKVKVILPVESIVLNKNTLELAPGETATLVATVMPAEVAEDIVWESSDETVVTVDDGVVSARSLGTASITVTAGSKSATCEVHVIEKEPFSMEAVDLGLSVKWANANLGATAVEDHGDYYAWGEVKPRYTSQNPFVWREGEETGYDWAAYKWCNGTYDKLTKYCTADGLAYWDGEGSPDNKVFLDDEDDVARVLTGGQWRMPTPSEMIELINECTWKWSSRNGINGYEVTSKKNGNSIFFPVTGCAVDTRVDNPDNHGGYWTLASSMTHDALNGWPGDYDYYALHLYFFTDFVDFTGTNRYDGRPIRPVLGEFVHVTGIKLPDAHLSMKSGESLTLTPIFYPSNSTIKRVQWSSSDEDIVSVKKDGTLKAKNPGEATIMAASFDGGFTATCTVQVESSVLSVAIDGHFSEWDTLTAETADGEYNIYEENSNPDLTGMLRLKLTSDEDNIYVYTELNFENIYLAEGGPYAQGGSWTGFLPTHPGTPGALIIYVGTDTDATGAYAARSIGEDESMWDYKGFDAFPQYYFLFDIAAYKMQFGWNQNNWPQNHGYDPWAKDDWWGKPLGSHGDGWWGDDVEGTPASDNTVSDENSFKFSGIEKVKDPVSKKEVNVIKIEFAMDRSAINENGAKVKSQAVIGAFYEQVGDIAKAFSATGSGKLPSGNKAVTLMLLD